MVRCKKCGIPVESVEDVAVRIDGLLASFRRTYPYTKNKNYESEVFQWVGGAFHALACAANRMRGLCGKCGQEDTLAGEPDGSECTLAGEPDGSECTDGCDAAPAAPTCVCCHERRKFPGGASLCGACLTAGCDHYGRAPRCVAL